MQLFAVQVQLRVRGRLITVGHVRVFMLLKFVANHGVVVVAGFVLNLLKGLRVLREYLLQQKRLAQSKRLYWRHRNEQELRL